MPRRDGGYAYGGLALRFSGGKAHLFLEAEGGVVVSTDSICGVDGMGIHYCLSAYNDYAKVHAQTDEGVEVGEFITDKHHWVEVDLKK